VVTEELVETVGLVDTRQPSNVRLGLINLGWEEIALKAGDYQWRAKGKTYGMESKTTSDLVSSFTKKASSGLSILKDELIRLREAVDVPILLILDGLPEITWDKLIIAPGINKIINTSWDALANFLTTAYTSGIIPVFGTSVHEIERVDAIRKYFCRDEVHAALSELPILKYRTDPKPLALMGIPGISKKKACDLFRHFGSLGKIAETSSIELMALPGIGPVLAKNIWNYFR